ncbi:MAG: NAD(P)-dependent glycerol-3-phosphate dehydrogenase [Oscillospiraceae bacterium]|nr:NAD(P)-dependent glycerol-3-phosphate dehydrogenase [Oscillospiraceae bacterium]
MSKIAVLGAGTWGTALAGLLSDNGHRVYVWSALAEEVEALSAQRRHPKLPGFVIPEQVAFTGEIGEACRGAEMAVFVVPSIYIRDTARAAAPYLSEGQVAVSASKGIEAESLMFLTQVIEDEAGKALRVAALSGPTHAEEVSLKLPTTVVSASADPGAAGAVQDAFMNPVFRVYTNGDIYGVQLCGAVKNIIALASGIAHGLGYGDNTCAALITRGMAEISRLGIAMGFRERTFYGLAGIGDLIVTATSRHSRNYQCGYLLGGGAGIQEAQKRVGMVVEGIHALPATMRLSAKYGVEMPVAAAVDDIVSRGAAPREVVNSLMMRAKKAENDEFV